MRNIHGYVKKKKETAHDTDGEIAGVFSIPKASRGEPIMQVSSFDTNMKPQKNIAFWTGFFRAVGRKNRRWHGSSRYVTEQWDAAEL